MIVESSKPVANHEYSRTKLQAEKFLISYCKKNKLRLVVLRLPTVYGRGARKNSFFEELKRSIISNSIFIRLNWPGITDLVHVNDVAKTIAHFIKNPPTRNSQEIYTLSAEHINFSQAVREMCTEMLVDYNQIRLPTFFWFFLKITRSKVGSFEKILPIGIYNLFWRASIVVDNVIWCDSTKIENKLKKEWKPLKLSDAIADLL